MTYSMLLEEKLNLLNEALLETDVDRGNVENCIGAIENNEKRFQKLKAIQVKLSLSKSNETEVEKKLENEILPLLIKLQESTSMLQERIIDERKTSVHAMNDFSHLKKISNSYVKTEQGPVFVDKDFK